MRVQNVAGGDNGFIPSLTSIAVAPFANLQERIREQSKAQMACYAMVLFAASLVRPMCIFQQMRWLRRGDTSGRQPEKKKEYYL